MHQLGFITLAQLKRLQAAGVDPKTAVDKLLAEAKVRHPHAQGVIMQRETDGFSILALKP